MKSKLITKILSAATLAFLCIVGYKVFIGNFITELEFNQASWREAILTGDRKTLYRMSSDLSEKINDGYIQTMPDAEEKLSITIDSRRVKIPLKRQVYFIATEPWYLRLEFDDAGKLYKHIIVPD